MKRLLGKALGILLSVTMMVSLVPGMAVFAAVDEGGETTNEESDSTEYSEALIAVLNMYDALPSVEDFELSDADDFFDFIVALESLEEPDLVDLFDAIPELDNTLDQYIDVLGNLLEEAEDDFFDKVEALPDPEDITLDDEADVKAARESFEKLPKFIQDYYLDDVEESEASSYYEKLVACEKKIADLKAAAEAAKAAEEAAKAAEEAAKAAEEKAAADKAKVDAVIKMIEDLPAPDKVTLDYYDAVYEAIDAYEDLEELGEGIDEALVEKLYADRIKVELLDLEDLISVSETLLSNYEDLLSADMITEFQDKIDAANEVLNAEDPAIEDIWNAYDDLLFAMYQANDIIWVHFTIVEGENAVYITNSDTGIKFRIRQEGIHDWAYELFLDAGAVILIDGEELPEGAAKTSKGSLIIEIMPDFLKTLSVGEHKLTVKFDNDVTMDLVFTVRAATDVPASGESVSAAVYVGIAMVVLAAAGFVVNKRMVKKES